MSRAFCNIDRSIVISNSFNPTTHDDESKILAWLSPLEPQVRHRDIGAQRVESVGDWLLETEEFRRWRNSGEEGESNHATLFFDGNPGVGKSHIISLVIDTLCDEAAEDDIAVTCFYFDFAVRNEQSPINMLGSLLRQLVSGLGRIPEAVVQSFRNQQKVIGGRGLQVSGILGMFQTIAATKRTFICVDAIDECVPEYRMVVLESLGQILRGSPDTRILLTGRPHIRSEVEREMKRPATSILIQPTEASFVRFLSERLRKDVAPDMMNAALKAEIMKSITELNSETFLLASLHIDAILRETTIARRRKRLQSLKDGAGLGDAYGATLERIKAQDRERTKLAIAALTWVCHAERPLRVDELCHALAVEIGASDFDPENVPSIGALVGCCQGLIIVDKEASTVRLIHFTVQEYLFSQPGLFYKPHSIIAETCLAYLNSQQVKNLSPGPLIDYQSMPFLKYSSRYWGTHASKELSESVFILALELSNRRKDHVSAVSLLQQAIHATYLEYITASPLFSGLHYASFFGIAELATALINEQGCDINQQDCAGRTPLAWAAERGHEGMVKILLEREDVDPNIPDKHDRTPLVWAAQDGNERVVQLLLEREDVDPNGLGKGRLTPLAFAAACGYAGVARLLLEKANVDPNCPGMHGLTPLILASLQGHEGVAKLLLERGNVDPNRPGENGITPFICASIQGHGGIVKLLLGREDIDPNASARDGSTPIVCASMQGHDGVVKVLLERRDIDPNCPGEHGQTPLVCAAAQGHERVIKLLLEREDVDPNHSDEDNRTPLVWATVKGHEGVVKLLLERENVDPNRPEVSGRTPLGCAAMGGHEGVVKLLLEREDVDPNRPDEDNRTPLGWAAIKGHEGVVKLLLERENVDPNHPVLDDRTPLGCAAIAGHEGVVKLLLERDSVDPNRPDKHDQMPLQWAAYQGHEGVVKLLLEREDIDLDRPDKCNMTPLKWAAARGHEGVVKLLRERENVDPRSPDVNDRTPLGCAPVMGHEGVVKPPSERGNFGPNQRNDNDQTPPGCAPVEGDEGAVGPALGRENANPTRLNANDRTQFCCVLL